MLKVKDVMSRDVRTVTRNDQLGVADKLMKDERIRHLPVIDEAGDVCAVVSQRDLFRGALLRALGKLVGIVTETDFVRLVAQGKTSS